MLDIFRILAVPLGFCMHWIYTLLQNYGWTIILFTFIVRLLMFPLSMKQQKSTTRMSAYQPMIQEIQKKWANDKTRQNQELQKFYEENNIKMTGGCAPMLVNMLVLFGIIAVVQMPLTYMLRIPTDQINTGVAIVMQYEAELDINKNATAQQSILIGAIAADPDVFVNGTEVAYGHNDATDTDEPIILANGNHLFVQDDQVVLESDKDTYSLDGTDLLDSKGNVVYSDVHPEKISMDADVVSEIADFKFNFAGLNLSQVPNFGNITSLILPILSVLTMIASQIIIMKTSGQTQGQNTMWIMTIAMSLFFGWYAFTVPAGFSLYYTASNVVMTVQQLVVRRIYDPVKIREEIALELEERKKAKKGKKQVAVAGTGGVVETKELTDTELAQLRLARAREMDAKQYAEDDAENEKLAKAREQDAQKYGKKAAETPAKKSTKNQNAEAADSEEADLTAEEPQAADGEDTPASDPQKAETPAPAPAAEKSKPGRRKRARDNKAKTGQVSEETSFADAERASENENSQTDE